MSSVGTVLQFQTLAARQVRWLNLEALTLVSISMCVQARAHTHVYVPKENINLLIKAIFALGGTLLHQHGIWRSTLPPQHMNVCVSALGLCTAWYLHSAVLSCWVFKRQCDRNSLFGIVGFLALCMLNLVFLLIQFFFICIYFCM